MKLSNNKPMGIFIIVMMLVCFAGCASQTQIEMPKNHTQIEYRDRVQKDTVYVKDSVLIEHKSDTVYINRLKYVYKERMLMDTAYVSITDTIYKSIYIERQQTFSEKVSNFMYGIYSMIAILVVLALIIAVIKRSK